MMKNRNVIIRNQSISFLYFLSSFEEILVVRKFWKHLVSFLQPLFHRQVTSLGIFVDEPCLLGKLKCFLSWSFSIKFIHNFLDFLNRFLLFDLWLSLFDLLLLWRWGDNSWFFVSRAIVLEFESSFDNMWLTHILVLLWIFIIDGSIERSQ